MRTQHVFSSDDQRTYYQQRYFVVIDAIYGELASRFSQSAMEKLGFIETTILDAANDRLQNLSTTGVMDPQLSVYGRIIDFQKLDSQLCMLPSVIDTVNEMKKREVGCLP